MGSVDIPPFLREQKKQKLQASEDIPSFLKKKEAVSEEPPPPSLSASATVGGILPDGTESTAPSALQSPLDIKGIFEFGKQRNKTASIPANLPRTASEVQTTLSKVDKGYVAPNELAELYSKDFGKPIVDKVINEYAPDLGTDGWDKKAFRSEEKWDELSKRIKAKNRTNAVVEYDKYITDVDTQLKDALLNLKTQKISTGGGTGGAAVNINSLSLPVIDVNNPWEYGKVIEQLKSADTLVDKDGNRLDGKKEQLIKYLDDKAKYYTSKQGVDADVLALGEKTTAAIARANINREYGESIPINEFAKNDKLNEEHFQLGLSFIKNVQPGQYKNLIRVIDEGKSIPDDDFRNLSNIGQQIKNQKTFFDAAANPELIDKETNLDYTTHSDKKADYAAIIGERIKAAGLNTLKTGEYSENIIKQFSYGLDNKKIVQELANEEKLIGYDAIPKSNAFDAVLQGINVPLDGIRSTFELIGESPTDTYIRSKKLDTGSAQKVVGEDGSVSNILPSDRGNIYYDALRGLGQFLPQVLLTKGIGGAATRVLAADARIAMTPALRSGITNYGGTAISTFLQTYGDSYADYLQKTGDHATARLGATIDSGAASIWELWLPESKIADKALSPLRKKLSNDIIDLVKKGGDPAELASKGRGFVEKFVTNTINIAGQEVGEEVGTQITDVFTEAIFSPQTAKDRDLGSEILETVKATAVSMAIPAILGGGGSSINRDFTKNAFNSAAINFTDYKQALDKQLNNDVINQQDYNAAIKLLTTHSGSINNAPTEDANGGTIDGQKQLDYAYEDTKIKVYKEKAANSEGVAKEMWDNKIKQSEDVQREIVMPKVEEKAAVAESILTEAEQTAIDSGRAKNPDLLSTLKEKAGEFEKGEDLQYFIDKAGEAPAQYIEKYGPDITNDLLAQIPTKKLLKNMVDMGKFDIDNPNIAVLEEEIQKRENTPAPSKDSTQNYPLEDSDKWASFGDEKNKGELTYTTPDEFLSKAKELEMNESDREKIDKLKQHILDGKKLDPLKVYSNVRNILGSNIDGRHRAVAAKELGIKEVPVLDYTTTSKDTTQEGVEVGDVVPSDLPKKITLKLSGGFADPGAANSAVKEVYEFGDMNELNKNQVVINGVKVDVVRDGGKILLKEISAIDQGKGAGTKVLKQIQDVADKNGVDIVLHPTKIANTSEADLIKWYKKNGFEDYSQGRLIYKSRSREVQNENTTGLVPRTESNSSLEEIGDAGTSQAKQQPTPTEQTVKELEAQRVEQIKKATRPDIDFGKVESDLVKIEEILDKGDATLLAKEGGNVERLKKEFNDLKQLINCIHGAKG